MTEPKRCPRCGGGPFPSAVSTSMMQFPEQYGFCQCIAEPAPTVAENSPAKHEPNDGQTNPNEPTLTCSEVVERLAKIAEGGCNEHGMDDCWCYETAAKIRELAPAILHSWRERREQELEEALMKSDSYLSLLRHRVNIPWGSTGFPQQGEVDQVIGKSRKLLAECAEQLCIVCDKPSGRAVLCEECLKRKEEGQQ